MPRQNHSVYYLLSVEKKFTGKSSKELIDLGQQLILQSEQLESAEKNSPASSEASVGYCPDNPLFQDSQDPYDGCNLDSD